MGWKTLKTDLQLKTDFVSVYKNKVELESGVLIEDFYTVKIQDAAAVIALTKDGQIILKKEYRYACSCDMIECPAGMVEEGEDPFETIQRELIEETGYTSKDWTYLGPGKESTAKLTNTLYIYLAKDCEKIDQPHLDLTEDLSSFTVPFEEAIDMVMDGRIWANGSAHMILKAARILGY